ncbi:hypothetical protein ONZ51_g9335 [Trametes cubensis]|uniref:Transcription factor tau subunit sfc6 n=1 Tax=Trametes cubensis TaxID=1111947 RepID=A0AAD7TNE8_9APHY|nr:hypothetical protein ONZ51_g9335 [Trametes cubensis]
MTRQLRTRASRPNYAALMGMPEDETGADPLTPPTSSTTTAAATLHPTQPPDPAEEDADMDLDDAEGEIDDEEVGEPPSPAKKRKQGSRSGASTRENSVLDYGSASVVSKAKKAPSAAAAKATPRRAVTVIPGLAMSTSKPPHAAPNLHHRHRSVGVYRKEGKVERLAGPPALFEQEATVLTNAWAASEVVSSRVNRSWGYNVGPGPLWELAEDRGWFKEAVSTNRTVEKEIRPRVHDGVALRPYEILSCSEATPYLPSDIGTTEEGALKPPPPVACSFGPYGKQSRREMHMFQALKMSEFFSNSKAHVFNAGAPVWGLDWCPIHPDDRPHHRFTQYLAVAPFPSKSHSPMIGTRVRRPSPACIQIWSLKPSDRSTDRMNVDGDAHDGFAGNEQDGSDAGAGEMRCEMDAAGGQGPTKKLGIIGGTFEDGSLTFYAVPDPSTIIDAVERPAGQPLLVKLTEPLLRIELEETACWAFDWANSDVVAVGCTNGSIAVYNVGKAFRGESPHQTLLPTHYFTAHQSAIRSLAWVRAPVVSASGEVTADDPTVIASGGYDGVECLTDIRDMCGNVINRTRDVVTAMEFSAYTGSAVTIDHENMVKAYSVSPSMLGRGHTILEPNGPIWSIATSDYHPQLAIGVTDGSCLTTNTMRTTRRGGLVETQNRPVATRQNKTLPVGTGAWPPEVGIHRVVWNDGNGLGRIPLLASATASGLCRVDWLMGRWVRDQLPYMGIEGMRGEKEGTFAEDEEESD